LAGSVQVLSRSKAARKRRGAKIVPYPLKPGFHILTPSPEFTKPVAEMTRNEAREAFNQLFLS
jgi:hypothetical protein